MKRWLIVGVLGAICAAAPGESSEQPRKPALKRSGWYSSYEVGREAARASGKPMMVVFRCER